MEKSIKVTVKVELDLDDIENFPLFDETIKRLKGIKKNINNHLAGKLKDKYLDVFEQLKKIVE